jgi:RimJ/RimL family protein N-acetyltransferase
VPNLVRWQGEVGVAVWWGEQDKYQDEITAKWVRRTGGAGDDYDRNTSRYIIVVDGNDIGHIQSYELRHYPEHAAEVDIPNSGGLDLFIGESEWRDRGIGTLVVRKFVDDVVFTLPGIETCIIDPDPANKRAIRSYEKAGFVHVKSYYSETNHENCYLMRQERGQR